MKKLILTFAIVLGLTMTSFANPNGNRGGLFQRGANTPTRNMHRDGLIIPKVPGHGSEGNEPALPDTPTAPLGSGIVLLTALGTAYLIGKRRKED